MTLVPHCYAVEGGDLSRQPRGLGPDRVQEDILLPLLRTSRSKGREKEEEEEEEEAPQHHGRRGQSDTELQAIADALTAPFAVQDTACCP